MAAALVPRSGERARGGSALVPELALSRTDRQYRGACGVPPPTSGEPPKAELRHPTPDPVGRGAAKTVKQNRKKTRVIRVGGQAVAPEG